MSFQYTPNKQKLVNQPVQNSFTVEKDHFILQNSPINEPTTKVIKKVQLYDDSNKKHYFSIVKDKQVGISSKYQDVVIDTWNDDDRKTSTTQLQKGISQTLFDLYSVISKTQLQTYQTQK